jgi:hypothetical protein
LIVRATKKPRRKTEGQVLEQATRNLLSALKKDMISKEGRVDYDKLRKEGYSERLLAKLEEA